MKYVECCRDANAETEEDEQQPSTSSVCKCGKTRLRCDLYHAIIHGTYYDVEVLLELGADNDERIRHNGIFQNAIDIAVSVGNAGAVKALAKSGCNLLHPSLMGGDLLRLGYDRGFYPIVEMLVKDFKMNPFKKDLRDGLSIFDLILEDDKNTNLLTGKLFSGAQSLFKAILDHPSLPSHIRQTNLKNGRTPLMSALAHTRVDMAFDLISRGAAFTWKSDMNGDTCLSLVTSLFSNKVFIEYCLAQLMNQCLTNGGRSADYKNDFLIGVNARVPALRGFSVPEFLIHHRVLIKRYPKILDLFDKYFIYPKYIAMSGMNNRGGNVHRWLLLATHFFNYPFFIRILRGGANTMAQDKFGNVIIQYAASRDVYYGDKRFLRALLEVGGSPNHFLRELIRDENQAIYEIPDEARDLIQSDTSNVKSLKRIVRNGIRSMPEYRERIMGHAASMHFPKDWIDFLNFEDLVKGQDFVSEHNAMPLIPAENLDDRNVLVNLFFVTPRSIPRPFI